MVASLQVTPFRIFFTFWIPKTFQQQVKILNQMSYPNVCIKPWKTCWRLYSYLDSLKCHKMPFTLLMMALQLQYTQWDLLLKASPGALTFSQDMLLNGLFIAEWQTISCNREALVNNALLKANQKRINRDYYVGHCVLEYDQTIKGKLAAKTSGPFEIVHIHVNGIITIQLWPGVTECIDICCTIPYNKPLV